MKKYKDDLTESLKNSKSSKKSLKTKTISKKKNSKNSIITAKDTISKIKKKIHPS